ncbi:MAG: alpha/beta hydrolase [Acidimicrobiales bacterium]
MLAGAEPWSAAGGDAGALVLHGLTGTPQSVRPLAEAFAEAGFTVELPLLPGHGTSVADVVPSRFEDWSGAAEAVCADLVARCATVVVAGLSMGGTLAAWLAARHEGLAGIVVVNPLLQPPAPSARAMLAGALAEGVETAPGIGSDIAAPGVSELAYPEMPIAATLSLFDAVEALAPRLPAIRCPVLLFSSRQDHVVPPDSGDLLAQSVSGPIERVWLEGSYHVATLDNDRTEIEAGAVMFARRVSAAPYWSP